MQNVPWKSYIAQPQLISRDQNACTEIVAQESWIHIIAIVFFKLSLIKVE